MEPCCRQKPQKERVHNTKRQTMKGRANKKYENPRAVEREKKKISVTFKFQNALCLGCMTDQ